MNAGHYTYLLLNLGTLLFPLAFSFDKKVYFYKKWPSLLPAIVVTAAIFIPWDMWKTDIGVWSFNPEYLLGIWIGNLPLEEWMFFFSIPYAILFIYECLKYYLPNWLDKAGPTISKAVFVLLIFVAMFFTDRIYTVVTFSFTAIFLLFHQWLLRNRYSGRFWVAYVVHLIPFFLVNGVLTSLPVVKYDMTEQIGFRIFSVPVEDSIYSMLLLLMNVTFYEFLQERRERRLSVPTEKKV